MCSPPIIPLPITPYLMVSLMRRTVLPAASTLLRRPDPICARGVPETGT